MPNWKKVVVSGSDAALNSLTVTANVVAQSFTGSLLGTASWATNATTASNVLGGTNNYIPLWSGSSALTSSVIYQTGSNIVIEGSGSLNPLTPVGLSASFDYGSGNYFAEGFSFNYRVYSYKESPVGRIYSPSYATLGADITDDGSFTSFNVLVSWTAVAGASGYRILLYNDYFGYNYDYGADITTNSYTDDGSANTLSEPDTSLTATLNSVNIKGTVNITGSINLNNGSLFTITNDKNIVIGWNGNNYGINDNVFIGDNAGYQATNVYHSNFLGFSAGYQASNSNNSNFLGYNAGYSASFANNSNFLGYNAGYYAINADNSNFLGSSAGYQATNANLSNFIGSSAGYLARHSFYSNFLGVSAGSGATSASFSNFIGNQAGNNATVAEYSNFIGNNAGGNATNANTSNFIGSNVGFNAFSASLSNFIGSFAGFGAVSASYSTLIGYQVGYNTAGGALGIKSNNIIIGTNITLENGRQDSINLGGLIFGTGSYSTIAGNPFSGSANGRIGINQSLPIFSLDVSGSGRYTNGLQVTGSLNAPIITGSIFGTASWAQNALTASFFSGSISNAVSSSYAATASWSINSISASYALTASNSQNASDILLYVKNISGAQINKGAVVRISGSLGDNPLIALADYTDDNNSANTLGLVTTNIPNDSFGYVMTEGTFIGYDTSTPGWTAGQVVYLGSSGSITGSAPRAPLHAVRLGQVLRVQQINGSIYVRIDNGYELGELHDIIDNTTNGSYGDLLVKSGSVWTNSKILTGSYGLTGSLTVTSTVTTTDLSVNGNNATFNSTNTTINSSNVTIGNDTTDVINIGGTSIYLPGTGNVAIGKTSSNAKLDVNGNTIISGSLTVTGSINAQTLVVQTITSSVEFNSGSTIFGTAVGNTHQFTGSVSITGSLNVVGAGITGSLFGTSSWATNAVSASYSNNFTVANQLTIDATLTDYATVASSTLGSNNVFTQTTGSYTSAFFKYTVASGSNTRAGEVVAAWNTGTSQFYDNSTLDIGNTLPVTSSVSIVAGNLQFNIQTNTPGWRIKSLATYI